MLNDIINGLLDAAVGIYGFFNDVLAACGGAWTVIYSMVIVMLVARFIVYPFLKGRIIGGVGEEIHTQGSRSHIARNLRG